MKIHALLGALGAVAVLAAAPTPVHAQVNTQHPSGMILKPLVIKRVTYFQICMAQNGSLCIQAMGAGNNVEVTTNGNEWQKITVSGGIEWQNGSGNCMKATSGGDVTVINGACDGGASKVWKEGGSGNDTFYSDYASGYMGTNGPTNGFNVYTKPAQQGFWYGWQLF